VAKALLYELGQSISYGRLSLLGKVFWPMLLASSDDQGRGLAELDVLKWRVCPNVDELTTDNLPQVLQEMADQHMIHLYTDSRGRSLYQVIRWWEFQQLAWAQPSRFESPENWSDRIRYQVKGGKQERVNWDGKGGFDDIPTSGLPSPLPSSEEGVQNNLTKPNSTQPNDSPTGDAGASTNGNGPSNFEDWFALVERPPEGSNRTAQLVHMHNALFPGRDPPDFGYVGKTAKTVGGAGRLAALLWQASGARPTGDVMRYCMGIAKGQKGADLRGQNVPELEAFQ